MVKTLFFHCRGHGFNVRFLIGEVPQTMRCGKKEKGNEHMQRTKTGLGICFFLHLPVNLFSHLVASLLARSGLILKDGPTSNDEQK